MYSFSMPHSALSNILLLDLKAFQVLRYVFVSYRPIIAVCLYQNPKLGCSTTVFQVNGVHYTSKRSDIEIMDRLNVPTKMDQNYGRSFLQLPFHWPHRNKKQAKMSDRNFDPSS